MNVPTIRVCLAVWIGAAGIMLSAWVPSYAGPILLNQAELVAPGQTTKELEPALQEIREGRNEEALKLIREQAIKHPDWAPPALILARLLFAAGENGPGRRALERAAAESPDHPDIYLTLGALAVTDGRYSDAKLNFEKAGALSSAARWGARAPGFKQRVLGGLASVAEAREDWTVAQEYLKDQLQIDPQNGQARHRLGVVLFRLGKTDEALAAFQQAVKDGPALDAPAVTMGRLFTQKGDLQKAEEWFDYAVKREPQSSRVRAARASWLLDQGRAAAARPEIEAAVKLDPKSADTRRLQALIDWHLRDLAGAERILEAIHRDAPADLAASDLLARCLIEQDAPSKRALGSQMAEVNARQSPRSPEALATLGWAYYRDGRVDEAEKVLRSAVQGVRITPDNAYYFARVLADKGKTEDARKILQAAARLPGAFAHRDDANALLKSLH